MSTDLSLNLFGTPRLSSDAGPIGVSPAPTLVFAYLALGPREGRTRERAAAELYSGSPEAAGRRRLSTALWRLRSELRSTTGYDLLDTSPERIAVNRSVHLNVDAVEFAELVGPALHERPDLLSADAVRRLERAVTLHRGLLVEHCHDDWILVERSRLEGLYLVALDHLLVHYGSLGELGAVGKYGELALAVEPLREDVHRHLMAAYGAAGRDDLVERQFARCRHALLVELGADPMPETLALYSRLRAPLAPATSPSVSALTADLQAARRDLDRLAVVIDRALGHLSHL
jgi:DNA-binding SARP family transcriptional activator